MLAGGDVAMLNLLSIEDAARALALAALHTPRGAFNVPGADLLPLSELIHRVGSVGVPVPGPLLAGVSALRRGTRKLSADLRARLHYGAVVDGSAALRAFEYSPEQRITLTDKASHRPGRA